MFLVSNYYRMCCIILFLWQSNLIYAAKTFFKWYYFRGGAVYRYHFIILTI